VDVENEALTSIGVWTLTAETIDRAGDIVRLAGIQTDNYEQYPVLLLNHDSTKPIGVTKLLPPDGNELRFEGFIAADSSDYAATALKQVQSGILHGCSQGFRPIKAIPTETGIDYQEIELIEISLTPTPANPAALRSKSNDNIVFKSFEITDMTEVTETETQTQTAEFPPIEEKSWQQAAPAIAKPAHEYSLKAALGVMLGLPGVDGGYEREIAAEIARRSPQKSWSGFPIPPGALVRKTNAGAPAGNLNPLTAADAGDRLLSFVGSGLARETLADRLGITVESTNDQTLKVPVIDGKLTGHVVAQDGDIPTSDSSSDSTDLSPKTAGARTAVNRSTLYAHRGDEILRMQIGQAVTEIVDKTIVGPTPGGAVPPGLFDLADTATVGTIADTEAAYRVFVREVLKYKPQAPVQLLLPGSLVDVLAVTPRFTNAQQAVYSGGMIADTPVVISHELDESTPAAIPLACGDFSQMMMVVFSGGAIDLTANPYTATAWPNGGFELRGLLDFNVHLIDSAAILTAVSDQS
jgi:HK97 family phage prohead protease